MRKDATITAVYGRRGTGKSTLVKSILRDRSRVVVFDPTGEYARLRGYAAAATIAAVRDHMKQGWKRGFRIAYVPRWDHIGELHDLTEFVWAAQAPYDDGRDHRQVTLVVEEANLAMPASQLPRDKGGIVRAILQGRHRGIEIIGVTQRPALVHPNFRGNAAETWLFALEDYNDIGTVRRWLGDGVADQLKGLPVFTALHVIGQEITRETIKKPR